MPPPTQDNLLYAARKAAYAGNGAKVRQLINLATLGMWSSQIASGCGDREFCRNTAMAHCMRADADAQAATSAVDLRVVRRYLVNLLDCLKRNQACFDYHAAGLTYANIGLVDCRLGHEHDALNSLNAALTAFEQAKAPAEQWITRLLAGHAKLIGNAPRQAAPVLDQAAYALRDWPQISPIYEAMGWAWLSIAHARLGQRYSSWAAARRTRRFYDVPIRGQRLGDIIEPLMHADTTQRAYSPLPKVFLPFFTLC